jgi:ABC-type dipeptide/oligopeptide/nickel transport system ATPase component
MFVLFAKPNTTFRHRWRYEVSGFLGIRLVLQVAFTTNPRLSISENVGQALEVFFQNRLQPTTLITNTV